MLKSRSIFFAIIVLEFNIGCSTLTYWSEISPNTPLGWSNISNFSVYTTQFTCDSIRIQLKSFWTRSGLIGFPLVPFLPTGDHNKSNFYLVVYYLTKDSISFNPVEVALQIDSSNQLVNSVECYRSTNVINRSITKENQAMYVYKYDLNTDTLSTFKVVFPSEYYGCKIPSVTYDITRKTEYKAWVIPTH